MGLGKAIASAARSGTFRSHSFVAPFPRPNGVRVNPCVASDLLNGEVSGLNHNEGKIIKKSLNVKVMSKII